ncbi:acyltransferase [Aerococcus urinaeequi]|uniref:Acyltransferase n=1 Tax=Aerococcus urinaeequi TaxID=51665 RepID=A0AA47G7Y0_9LACT|nr:acyltransferase [Aerococcus urinaeequi]WAT23973.1 acyltransferase [Aerococcus urinaeequi]
MGKTIRKSNFELLRIVSMLMIVALHYFNGEMGGALKQQTFGETNYFITLMLVSFSIVGVNIFVLITGYFMANTKSIILAKPLGLLIQMTFYAVIFYLIGLWLGYYEFNVIHSAISIFPFLKGYRWFIETYIILYTLSPFINRGLDTLSHKDIKILLSILLIFFSIWPSVWPYSPTEDSGYGIINFVLMYTIGYYIKKHYVSNQNKWKYFGWYVITSLAATVGAVFLEYVGIFSKYFMWGYNNILMVSGATLLFLFFSKIDLQSKVINKISKYTLGVFFIHSDPSINTLLYRDVLHTQDYWHSKLYILHFILSIIIVYIISTIIDFIREKIFVVITDVTKPQKSKYLSFLYKDLP